MANGRTTRGPPVDEPDRVDVAPGDVVVVQGVDADARALEGHRVGGRHPARQQAEVARPGHPGPRDRHRGDARIDGHAGRADLGPVRRPDGAAARRRPVDPQHAAVDARAVRAGVAQLHEEVVGDSDDRVLADGTLDGGRADLDVGAGPQRVERVRLDADVGGDVLDVDVGTGRRGGPVLRRLAGCRGGRGDRQQTASAAPVSTASVERRTRFPTLPMTGFSHRRGTADPALSPTGRRGDVVQERDAAREIRPAGRSPSDGARTGE